MTLAIAPDSVKLNIILRLNLSGKAVKGSVSGITDIDMH